MNTILVPIDFDATSENALNYAIGLASFFSGSLILLHVDSIRLYNFDPNILTHTVDEVMEISLEKLKQKAIKIRNENIRIVDVNFYVEGGNHEKIIADYITNYKIDYVVMGISGPENNLAKKIFGNISIPISKTSEAPVFIVPDGYQFKKIQNIAYASEYGSSIKEQNGLFQIKYINKLFDSKLSVLHVISENHLMSAIEAEADMYIEQVLENTNHKTFVLSEDKASKGLLNFIKTHDIDLIVVEPKKHSFFHKLFYPSTTTEISFDTPIPVLTIHS